MGTTTSDGKERQPMMMNERRESHLFLGSNEMPFTIRLHCTRSTYLNQERGNLERESFGRQRGWSLDPLCLPSHWRPFFLTTVQRHKPFEFKTQPQTFLTKFPRLFTSQPNEVSTHNVVTQYWRVICEIFSINILKKNGMFFENLGVNEAGIGLKVPAHILCFFVALLAAPKNAVGLPMKTREATQHASMHDTDLFSSQPPSIPYKLPTPLERTFSPMKSCLVGS